MSGYIGRFYAGKTVLITGHTGFKGSWLKTMLEHLGACVVGLSLPDCENPNHFDLLFNREAEHNLWLDIADFDLIKNPIVSSNPDIIFHLAAQSSVLEGYQRPLRTISSNVMGTANVLEAARLCSNTRAIIVVTSDKCYLNNNGSRTFHEGDRLGGVDPYSGSKACAEIVSDCYREAFFSGKTRTSLATARAGNVIGGGDWTNQRIVTDAIEARTEKRPLVLRNPDSTRPWQHVLDPLLGYLLLAHKIFFDHTYGGAYNFGPEPEAEKSVKDLALAIGEIWGPLKIVSSNCEHLPEAKTLSINSAKARSILGWTPRIDFGTAVKMTADWYKSYYDDGVVMTRSQIDDYFTWNL